MHSLFSVTAGARVRWHDLPGQGIPAVFVHGHRKIHQRLPPYYTVFLAGNNILWAQQIEDM